MAELVAMQAPSRERGFCSHFYALHVLSLSFAAEQEREQARCRTSDALTRKARSGHVRGGAC
jgi:DNA invertase Pin-like site-specific DNA recombinase